MREINLEGLFFSARGRIRRGRFVKLAADCGRVPAWWVGGVEYEYRGAEYELGMREGRFLGR
ncbi:MAG: hypothetical protein EA381_20915 [Planctomycetaceae bacterium]|nr:MAG: hypothetical protein EA381_20915 [Planctomycetaceae bacterium]